MQRQLPAYPRASHVYDTDRCHIFQMQAFHRRGSLLAHLTVADQSNYDNPQEQKKHVIALQPITHPQRTRAALCAGLSPRLMALAPTPKEAGLSAFQVGLSAVAGGTLSRVRA